MSDLFKVMSLVPEAEIELEKWQLHPGAAACPTAETNSTRGPGAESSS